MEEIKENEFVRDRDGFIIKVNEIQDYKEDDDIWYEENILKGTWKSMIVKHSSNIKDLIQAGDIIIYTINCKIADIDIVKEHTDSRTLEKSLRVGLWSLEQVNIKQILTKEQFERKSYRLEE